MRGLHRQLGVLLLVIGSGCGVSDEASMRNLPIGTDGQELQYCTTHSDCGEGATCAGNVCRPLCDFAASYTGCPPAQYCCMGYAPTETGPHCATTSSACLWGVYLYP